MSKYVKLLEQIDSFYKQAIKLDITNPTFIDPSLEEDDYKVNLNPSSPILDVKKTTPKFSLDVLIKNHAAEALKDANLVFPVIERKWRRATYQDDKDIERVLAYCLEELLVTKKLLEKIISSTEMKVDIFAPIIRKLLALADSFYNKGFTFELSELDDLSRKITQLVVAMRHKVQAPGDF